jgi:cytochrome c553
MSGRVWNIFGSIFAGVIVMASVIITATIGWRPFIGPRLRPVTSRAFDRTAERLQRGKSVVDTVAGCADCHSPHDWTKPDAPILPGREFVGAEFPLKGLPGRIVAANLTPDPETGLGRWTDDEIARAIREGVDRNGRALFPLMPYQHYRNLPDEDLASVVVYLRSLQPVKNVLPPTEIIFPVRYLIRSVPEPLTGPVSAPDTSTPQRRGAYLVELIGCGDCHTPVRSDGSPIPNMYLGGGQVLEGPWGKVAAPNITPDPSGIPYYDAELFKQAIRTGMVRTRPLNPIMPWPLLRNMSDQDLEAIFAYLQSVKPVQHRVDNAETPTLCRICGAMHGLGDKN